MLEGEVFFCERCGRRLSDEDLAAGRARRAGTSYFCTKCPDQVQKTAPAGPRRAPRAPRAAPPRPGVSHGSRTTWGLLGVAAAAGIIAVAFIRFSRSSAPTRRTRRTTTQEEPPPETKVVDEPRALLAPRRPLGGRAGEEAVDFRTQGARDVYNEAVEYHTKNPTDLQGYVEKLFLVIERYAETSYAEEARKALPEPIPGEWTWWVMSGFDNTDRNALSRPFAPEDPLTSVDASATHQGKEGLLRWKELKCREHDGYVDMTNEFGHVDVVAYGFTYLHSDEDQSALLGVGSDDGVKVWVNGQVALEADEYRGWVRDENKVTVTLKRGANPLLLKLTQGGGPYSFSVTVRGGRSYARIANKR